MPNPATDRVLITGAAGAIGTALRNGLRADWRHLRLTDSRPIADPAPNEECIVADVADRAAIERMMPGVAAVVHLAGVGGDYSLEDLWRVNARGMFDVFEAARLAGVQRVVFASSLAVNGMQKHYGDRMITEDDYRHGEVQYAMHKIFNEWQAQDYNEKYGMTITAVRPANVTGPDKVRGSVDHVNIITQPAQGKPISFPYKDAMRCPIHVDDIAEVFTRVLLTDKPKQSVYNSGGIAISLGEIADMVREFLPDAQISFERETGGKASSGNYLIDNTRLVQEFGVQYLPYRQRVLQIINDIRREVGLPLVAG